MGADQWTLNVVNVFKQYETARRSEDAAIAGNRCELACGHEDCDFDVCTWPDVVEIGRRPDNG
jgi:hypothetical protein